MNENKNSNNKKESDKFKNFKIENMKKILTLNTLSNNKIGGIWCLKILDDGRLAAGDCHSNLIIYNQDTFNTDIIIQNNLSILLNFIQLKNKNIACSFLRDFIIKILKIIIIMKIFK